MDEYSTTVNDLMDAYKEQTEDTMWVKAKLADLEDCSRRNNIKLRGVPESVTLNELQKFAGDLIATLLPEVSQIERLIDRIHRIPKTKHLEASIPRDVLMKIQFFPTKEKLLTKARSLTELPTPHKEIHLYADLSQYTLNLRRQLKTTTKALYNHKSLINGNTQQH